MFALFIRFGIAAFAAVLAVIFIKKLLYSPGVIAHMSKRRFEKAYRLAKKRNQIGIVTNYLRESLSLPSENLRQPMVELFNELSRLDIAASDNRNTFVDASFLSEVSNEAQKGFRALWRTVENLDVVARQEVAFDSTHPKIQKSIEKLQTLTVATRDARSKFAELSLGEKTGAIGDAASALRIVGKQAEALTSLDELI